MDGLWTLDCAVPSKESQAIRHAYALEFFGMVDANRDLVSDGYLRRQGMTPVFQDRNEVDFDPYVAIDGAPYMIFPLTGGPPMLLVASPENQAVNTKNPGENSIEISIHETGDRRSGAPVPPDH